MTKQELWALIEYHANEIVDHGRKMCISRGTHAALDADYHGLRISDLAKQVYPLEMRDQEAKTAASGSNAVGNNAVNTAYQGGFPPGARLG